MANLYDLYQLGQSTWLNYLRRSFIESGELKDAVQSGVSGITSTPLIFEKAITSSADYDTAVRAHVAAGKPVKEIYELLVADDIQRAADVLHQVFETTDGRDGFVTLELNPSLAHDHIGTVAEARHVLHEVNRPNAMVEIPATESGIAAIEALLHDGVNVNATHIFSLDTYVKVAQAYLRGLEMYIHSHSVWRQNPTSVASFSLNRIDQRVDKMLDELGRPDLKRRTAVALAKVAYQAFRDHFSGPTWNRLARRGALVQRLKWTRTAPLSYDYPACFYVDALIGADTVVTMTPATLNAYRTQGKVASRLPAGLEDARAHLAELEELGIDLERIGRDLQEQSLGAFKGYFHSMIDSVMEKRDQIDREWRRYETYLDLLDEEVDAALTRFCDDRTMCRIWAGDREIWRARLPDTPQQLGWMSSVETMQENASQLKERVRTILASNGSREPFRDVVVLTEPGSAPSARLFASTFSYGFQRFPSGFNFPPVSVYNTADLETIAGLSEDLDLNKTLFVIASRSGETTKTLSAFDRIYDRVASSNGRTNPGDCFVAITDPGTRLEEIARRFRFRDIFLESPEIGEHYSALSYTGLVPAALAGADIDCLLDRAFAMVCNAHSCNCPMKGDNIAAHFGTLLGEMAKNGRDKLTLVTTPSLSAFGEWAEKVINEGVFIKWERIERFVGDAFAGPEAFDPDTLYVCVRLDGEDDIDLDILALIDASLAVVVFNLRDLHDIGGLVFTWQMATAVAGTSLGVIPINEGA